MRKLCLSIAVGIAVGMPQASAAQTIGDPGTEPIFWCIIEYLRVDGLPLVKHGWCTRVGGPGSRIVPLLSDEGQGIVFGIRPYQRPADQPIPKRQERLE